MRCTVCGTEREVVCKMAELDQQVCEDSEPEVGITRCGGPLEVVIAPVPTGRFGFGADPGVVKDGRVYKAPRRRPATVQRLK